MGAGISIASNTAAAVASAYTSVINDTNVTNNQNVIQTQSVTLENCDMTAKKDINFDISATMKQAQTQIGNVTDDTTIANNIAQALNQAATTSVGVGVLGIADSNNQASTYANMSTNIANYVKFSSRQSSTANQAFTCQNSTIISEDGGINLSLQEMGKVTQYQSESIMNSSHVTNTITQTIKQTASASTGMSWWVVLAIAIVAIIAGVIFKLKDAKSNATRAIDIQQAIELGCCTPANFNLGGGGIGSAFKSMGRGTSRMSGNGGQCAGCDCYKLAHPEAHISKATVVIWIIGSLLIGGLIGIWYAIAMGRGCLSNDACGANSGSNFNGMMAGCSCNFEEQGDGDILCKDSISGTVNGNGVPLKYQYPLYVQSQESNSDTSCSEPNARPAASMQAILVHAVAKISKNSNSNNGKNMNTINRYLYQMPGGVYTKLQGLYGDADVAPAVIDLKNMYMAAVDYLDNLPDQENLFADFRASYKGGNDQDEKARMLFAFMCPLRPVIGTINDKKFSPTTYSSSSSSSSSDFWPGVSTPSLNYPVVINNDTSDPTKTTWFVKVPPAFQFGAGDDVNAAGCCSLHTMEYNNVGGNFSCFCGDASDDQTQVVAFCSGGQNRCVYPSEDSSSGNCSGENGDPCTSDSKCENKGKINRNECTGDTKLQYPNPDPSGSDCQPGMFVMQDDAKANALGVYAEWADFSGYTNELVCSFIRLLWAGTLSYVNDTANTTIYGINALLSREGDETAFKDHYYVPKVQGDTSNTYGRIGDSVNSLVNQVNDPQLLHIQFIGSNTYSERLGLPIASCNENATAIRGQGYTAFSKKIGYCRDKFFNRITLWTLVGLLIFWVLSLPAFIIMRWYVNKGASGKYLSMVNRQNARNTRPSVGVRQNNNTNTNNTQKSTSQPQDNAAPSEQVSNEVQSPSQESIQPTADTENGMEMTAPTANMKRLQQNMKLNDKDRATVTQQMQEDQQRSQPATQPTPQETVNENQMSTPLGVFDSAAVQGGHHRRNKRKRHNRTQKGSKQKRKK
jgi:hypothetical protein